MVRNYIRKTDRAASYSREQLLEAVEKVKNGELSAYRASLAYKIPRPTIVARVYGRYGLKSDSLGRSTFLSAETEKKLAKNLHIMEKYGLGLTREETFELVGQYIAKNNIPNNFKNGTPGEDWFLSFKKRHALSVKKPQAVENSRKKACNPWVIYSYFDLLKNTLDELELHDKPEQIWNLDETSFSKDPSKTKVVGLRGYASTRTIASPGKDNTTVLLGCSAAGGKTPPLIVYKGKNLWDEWISAEGFPGTVYAATTNGWMESEVFETFFQKVFLPTVGDRRPVLLIYDGHSTHVGINIIEKAREADITIMKIPPHTSDNLQPLDLAVNKSFKDKWDQSLVKWQRLHVGQALPKKEFSKLIGQVWSQIDPQVCVAGFRKAGIFPFNSHAVPQEKFNLDQLVEWKKQQKQLTKCNEITTSSTTISKDLGVQLQTAVQQIPGTSSSKDQFFIPKLENVVPLVPSLLSICLSRWNFYTKANIVSEHVQKSPKVTILEDRLIKLNVTFEDLLLAKINAGTHNVKRRKKVASGAEIITSEVVYIKQRELEEEKKRKLKQKEEKQLKKNTKEKKAKLENKTNNSRGERRKNLKSESYQKKKKMKTNDSTSDSDIDIELMDESDVENGDYFTELLHTNNDDTDVVGECEDEVEEAEVVYIKQRELEEEKNRKLKQKEEKQLKKNTKEKKAKLEKKTNNSRGERRKNLKSESNQKKKKMKANDSTSDSDMDIELMDESDVENGDYFTKLLQTNNDDTDVVGECEDEENNYDEPPTSNVHKGQWVLVKFTTKTSVKHYIGVVTELNCDGIPTVKFVRKSIFRGGENKSTFVFPNVPDICEVRHLDDIECKLPDPTIGRRGQIFFKMSFQGYNIQ